MPHFVSKADAKALGLKRYFTGEPCKRGHIAARYKSGGCIICVGEYNKAQYQAHPEKWAKWIEQRRRHPRRKMPELKSCLFCGEVFVSAVSRRLYCTSQHQRAAEAQRYKSKGLIIRKICLACVKEFEVQGGSGSGSWKYCFDCRKEARNASRRRRLAIARIQRTENPPKPKYKRTCIICDTEFEALSPGALLCSEQCKKTNYNAWMRNWRAKHPKACKITNEKRKRDPNRLIARQKWLAKRKAAGIRYIADPEKTKKRDRRRQIAVQAAVEEWRRMGLPIASYHAERRLIYQVLKELPTLNHSKEIDHA